MAALQVRYHQDPSHGWLEVPRSELVAAGIANKVSRYSYQRGNTVYLEEDCDAPLFVQACQRRGIDVLPIAVFTEAESFIRRLDPFSA